jgi:peptidyl-prolyl cis-trans isomerase B (cyclophilin B)
MIQGGDPTGTGGGGPGYKLKAEFNETKHVRGVLSAARTPDPNSAGSQFFIMHGEAPHLDRQYTAYGKVVEGMETVDKIAQAPTGEQDRPTNPVSIKGIKIEEKAASK